MATPNRKQIKVLDSATIDRIAAGEVIERPASIVKELAENALDAGATTITIDLIDGGLASIAVEDDGHGIAARELPLACERHATSKIASAADILQVGTFGFRGEALASMASVSRLRIVSRAETDEVGGLIELDGGQIQRREPAPRNRGTTVTVSDLFYNTPARRKYLKSAQAERRAVVKAVTALALAHWEVRWRLRADNGQTLIDLLPNDSLPARARDVLGASVADHMARFELEAGGFAVAGLASRPTWVRGNREQQYLYVNRRPIESGALSQAIFQAYREVIPPGKHPVVIAFLQVPAGEVDVNVHPAKSEVRLLLERQVFSLLKQALQDGLSLRATAPFGASGTEGQAAQSEAAQAAGGDGRQAGIAAAEADFLRRHFQGGADGGAARQPRLFDRNRWGGQRGGAASATDPEAGTFASAGDQGVSAVAGLTQQAAPFWQLHRTYIVTQIRGGLVLIDQHNSHERILYNDAKQALEENGRGVPTQQLLFPAHLELSPVQIQAFHAHEAQLAALGFTIQPFGGQAVLVQGIPASLKNWNEGQLLLDILDDLTLDERPSQPAQVDLIASYACHAAVRAGEPLTVPEMQNLVDQLFATDTPLSCPHGRPTLIQFTLEELEKRFGRR
jgi:DNA mismatch repair protein MutL